MSRLACITLGIALTVLALPGAVKSSDRPALTPVVLEARPSPDCFPVSSLQQAELEKDFCRICPDCKIVTAPAPAAGYRIVIEDPGLGWKLLLYDSGGQLIKTLEWTGPLDKGLAAATLVIHKK